MRKTLANLLYIHTYILKLGESGSWLGKILGNDINLPKVSLAARILHYMVAKVFMKFIHSIVEFCEFICKCDCTCI